MRFTSRLLLAVVLAVAALGGLLAVAAAPAHAVEAGRCGKWAATNGSDANDGSQARPYRSLNRLVQSLGPGGVGCIAGGTTYSATEGYGIVRSGGGTAASPVTITSGGSGRARIYGQIDIQAPTHDIVFTDLDFIGTHTDAAGNPMVPRANTINLRGDRLTLRGNSITNPFGICINAGYMEDAYSPASAGDPADDLVITENVIYGCGMSPKLVWEPQMSGAHGIYLVWTRNARITENIVVGNRYRGFQSWPRSEGTLVANNLFDRNATHVNLGSALREGAPWHTAGTVVRDNILTNRTDWVPEKNQAGVVGNFPAGSTYGNVVEGNCIDPARGTHAGNGFEYRGNTHEAARFVDPSGASYRLAADSPCRGKGPAVIQPASAPVGRQTVAFGTGACVGGKLRVTLPTVTSARAEGEWVFARTDVARWDGRQWTLVTPFAPWRYGWAGPQGTVALDQAGSHWATYDDARRGSTARATIELPATPGYWYAVYQTVWFSSDGSSHGTWTAMDGEQVFCRA